jgi:predicted metallopeptidase
MLYNLRTMLRTKRKAAKPLDFREAEDVKARISHLVDNLDLPYIQKDTVYSVRSDNSRARIYARIWGLSRIFQEAAGLPPLYVIEVVSKYYDPLPEEKKYQVLLHELMHIPTTFSGALLPHTKTFHSRYRAHWNVFKKRFF